MTVTSFNELNPDLERWLASATEGLAPVATERERAELASHLRDAIECRMEQGEEETAAAAIKRQGSDAK